MTETKQTNKKKSNQLKQIRIYSYNLQVFLRCCCATATAAAAAAIGMVIIIVVLTVVVLLFFGGI